MKVRFFKASIFAVCCCFQVSAQCPTASFSAPATACLGERMTIGNLSAGENYEWDFCTGELSGSPAAQTDLTLPGAIGRPAMEFAKDGSRWFGFITGTYSNSLYRLEYSDGLDEEPSVENLSDLQGALVTPGPIRIFRESGNWYGLVIDVFSLELIKLSFGTSLSNLPSVDVLASGIGTLNAGLAVGKDKTHGWVCVTSNGSNQFMIIKLGLTVSAPLPSDIIVSAVVPNPNNLGDVDLVYDCDQWYAFASNLGNGNIYRLEFGSNLFQAPTIDQLADVGLVNGGRLRTARDGERYSLFVTSLGGDFFKVDLTADLQVTNPLVSNLGNFSSALQNSYGLAVAKDRSFWKISVIDQSTGKLSSVVFPGDCCTIVQDDAATDPIVQYLQPGVFNISLTVEDDGYSSVLSKSITITAQNAPDIGINTQNICVGHDVIFVPQNTSADIVTYDWDFGDMSSSPDSSPLHVYAAAGEYEIDLEVTSGNGCRNTASSSLKMYDEPVPTFTLPTGVICTNNEFNFINTTTDDFEGNLSYQWFVDGITAATSRDMIHTFNSPGDKDIKLVTAIPGCGNETTHSLSNVQEGPQVDFEIAGQCEDEAISFTNISSGDVAGYTWEFGNGNTGSVVHPTEIYSNAGTYTVALHAAATNGCVNTKSTSIIIYTRPLADFALDLPPFSCSGTPSQFHDLTPGPADSNLQSWNWTFGDGGENTEKDAAHIYSAAGSYDVSLTVTTDRGCSNNVQKQITISPSPVVDFSHDPSCVALPSQFTATPGTSIKAWQWKINNANYAVQNPAHTFSAPGNFTAQLTATANNNCVTTVTKTVIVPVLPAMNFSAEGLCVGQPTILSDLTLSAADPITKRDWEFPGAHAGSGLSVAHTFSATGIAPVKLSIENQSGCKYTLSKNIVINSVPKAGFTTSEESGPAPFDVQFTNTTLGAVSYAWKFNDPLNTVKTETSPSFIFNALGEYEVELIATSDNGCPDSFTKSVYVIVPHPELALEELTLVPDNVTGRVRALVRVRNNSNYTIRSFGITIDLGSQIQFTEMVNLAIRPGETDVYVLSNELVRRPEAGYLCANVEIGGDENSFNDRKCTSFGDEAILFHPFPNPSAGLLTVDVISEMGEQVRIRLVNSQGAAAYDKELNGIKGLNTYTLDLTDLSPGIYLALVETQHGSKTYRIMLRY